MLDCGLTADRRMGIHQPSTSRRCDFVLVSLRDAPHFYTVYCIHRLKSANTQRVEVIHSHLGGSIDERSLLGWRILSCDGTSSHASIGTPQTIDRDKRSNMTESREAGAGHSF